MTVKACVDSKILFDHIHANVACLAYTQKCVFSIIHWFNSKNDGYSIY